MIAWLNLTPDQRKTTLAQASARSGIIEKAIEKDWWVTLTLHALFSLPHAEGLFFKGGTSLSKCWKLINRFSEDIDIAMSPSLFGMEYVETPSRSFLNRLKKRGCYFTSNELKNALFDRLIHMGVEEQHFTITVGAVRDDMPDKDPQEIYIRYSSLYEINPYLSDEVKIEVGVRSKIEPFTSMPIQSLLSEYFPNPIYGESPFKIQVVEPQKTFLEKAFLLHELFNRGEGVVVRTERVSRHYHDLVKMMDTEIGLMALQDRGLYSAIIAHRRNYNKIGGIDYDHLHPPHINFVPPEALLNNLLEDYDIMLETMIYGDAPSGKDLFQAVETLNLRFKEY